MNVHDDVLEGQDAAWRVEARLDARPNMRPDAALAGEIGKASNRVHGKNPRRVLPPVLAMACALAMHAVLLAATIVWLGSGSGPMVGPGILALNLAASTMGHGGGNPGPTALPAGQPEPGPTAAPPEACANQAEPRPVAATPPNTPTTAPSVPPKPTPPQPKKTKTAPAITASPPPKPRPEPTSAQTTLPSAQPEAPAAPAVGPTSASTTGSGPAAAPGQDRAEAQDGASSGSGESPTQGGGGKAGGGEATFTFGDPNGPGITRLVRPEYPREARRQGKEGTVILKLSLDASGEVDAVEILRSAGFGMEEAAREAALRSRFRPATMNGRPVACQAILPLHFQLR